MTWPYTLTAYLYMSTLARIQVYGQEKKNNASNILVYGQKKSIRKKSDPIYLYIVILSIYLYIVNGSPTGIRTHVTIYLYTVPKKV